MKGRDDAAKGERRISSVRTTKAKEDGVKEHVKHISVLCPGYLDVAHGNSLLIKAGYQPDA